MIKGFDRDYPNRQFHSFFFSTHENLTLFSTLLGKLRSFKKIGWTVEIRSQASRHLPRVTLTTGFWSGLLNIHVLQISHGEIRLFSFVYTTMQPYLGKPVEMRVAAFAHRQPDLAFHKLRSPQLPSAPYYFVNTSPLGF